MIWFVGDPKELIVSVEIYSNLLFHRAGMYALPQSHDQTHMSHTHTCY